jgi:uncharacterized protein YfkK (UPF0435 family)
MPTQNRRVATYLPPHIDEPFKSFKSQRNIKGDSEALIAVLSEYFQVSQEVAYPSSSNLLQKIEAIEKKLGSLKGELFSELKVSFDEKFDKLSCVIQEIQRTQSQDQTLSTCDLARRLGMANSSLSHWKNPDDPKRGKSPEALLEATRAKDPEGIGWILFRDINRFKPERPIGSPKIDLQGELLSSSSAITQSEA